jgi:hypothetical protein
MINFNSLIPLVGLTGAILLHAFATVWWAAKVTTKMDNLTTSLVKIDRELEKRDTQISAIWKRIDEVRDMVSGK